MCIILICLNSFKLITKYIFIFVEAVLMAYLKCMLCCKFAGGGGLGFWPILHKSTHLMCLELNLIKSQ